MRRDPSATVHHSIVDHHFSKLYKYSNRKQKKKNRKNGERYIHVLPPGVCCSCKWLIQLTMLLTLLTILPLHFNRLGAVGGISTWSIRYPGNCECTFLAKDEYLSRVCPVFNPVRAIAFKQAIRTAFLRYFFITQH